MKKKIVLFFGICFVMLSSLGYSKDVIDLTNPVIDKTNSLHERTITGLNTKLKELYKQTEVQIQVVIIDSLDGDPIENYAIKLFDDWKLGNSHTDKGVLFLVSLKDHKTNITVGRGLEGDLTDLQTHRILENVKPYFKDSKIDEGTIFAINSIIKLINIDPKQGINDNNGYDLVSIILWIIGCIIILSILMALFGFDGFIIFRFILDIIFLFIGSGGGWSGGGGGSAGGGNSDDF